MLPWATCGIEGASGRPFRARLHEADSIPWALPRATIERPFGPPSLRVPLPPKCRNYRATEIREKSELIVIMQ